MMGKSSGLGPDSSDSRLGKEEKALCSVTGGAVFGTTELLG
jgi:hypothetical protein